MSNQTRTIVCHRRGVGFAQTENCLEWLARRGTKVVSPMLCATCFMKVGPLPKQEGQVKWFNSRKCYGFIVAEEGEEIFFHQRQIVTENKGDAHAGQIARFHIRHSTDGETRYHHRAQGINGQAVAQ